MFIIEAMMNDHENIRRMMKVMRAIDNDIRNGNVIEVEDVERIIDFLRVYGDEHHHHKEEVILFPAMLETIPMTDVIESKDSNTANSVKIVGVFLASGNVSYIFDNLKYMISFELIILIMVAVFAIVVGYIVGNKYSLKFIKTELKSLYDSLNIIGKTAKATDLGEWFELRQTYLIDSTTRRKDNVS